VKSQRFTQGGINNFDVCVGVVVGDAILEVLNKDVIFAGNRRTKTKVGSKPDLLMQNSPCSDKVVQSLEAFFCFNTFCKHQNQPCLAGP
jgi:hypothetical protein